jgi:hypothetical protein
VLPFLQVMCPETDRQSGRPPVVWSFFSMPFVYPEALE